MTSAQTADDGLVLLAWVLFWSSWGHSHCSVLVLETVHMTTCLEIVHMTTCLETVHMTTCFLTANCDYRHTCTEGTWCDDIPDVFFLLDLFLLVFGQFGQFLCSVPAHPQFMASSNLVWCTSFIPACLLFFLCLPQLYLWDSLF